MRRREFITLVGGAAVAWPVAVYAQKNEGIRRIGVLKNTPEGDPEAKVELAAFEQELKNLGWREGQNIRIDYRFGAGDAARMAAFAKELVAMKPDVIVARSTPALKALATETSTIPIVFISVSDPVGEGLAASLARPGGNATGFTNVESAMAGKWVELLKEITRPQARDLHFQPTNCSRRRSLLHPLGRARRRRPRRNRDFCSRLRALRH